jgi:hypothetical protein
MAAPDGAFSERGVSLAAPWGIITGTPGGSREERP